MPENGVAADVAAALVHDELILDGNSRQNLATFCTTWVAPQVRDLARARDRYALSTVVFLVYGYLAMLLS